MTQTISIKGTVGYALARACKLHRQRAEELLTEIGLHVGQEMLLAALQDNDGMTQSDLAELLMIQPSTVTNSLRRLERDGIVGRVADSEDQRITRVHMTDKAQSMMESVGCQWAKLEESAFSGFTVEERVLLRRLLMQVSMQ
ncbi:MAG: MarR family transcriptional regulator [Candidatus Poseidoniales archaeon]|nr:MAG: MarR family transcriptional regulator [Candidatus Poseidoniales archaeon]